MEINKKEICEYCNKEEEPTLERRELFTSIGEDYVCNDCIFEPSKEPFQMELLL